MVNLDFLVYRNLPNNLTSSITCTVCQVCSSHAKSVDLLLCRTSYTECSWLCHSFVSHHVTTHCGILLPSLLYIQLLLYSIEYILFSASASVASDTVRTCMNT